MRTGDIVSAANDAATKARLARLHIRAEMTKDEADEARQMVAEVTAKLETLVSRAYGEASA